MKENEREQSDWNETNKDSGSFIKNKPNISELEARILKLEQLITFDDNDDENIYIGEK